MVEMVGKPDNYCTKGTQSIGEGIELDVRTRHVDGSLVLSRGPTLPAL